MSDPTSSPSGSGWSPAMRKALDDAITSATRQHAEPLAVFDCDNTCIRGDIGDVLWEALVVERALCFSHPELRRLVSLVDPEVDAALRLAMTSGDEDAYLERWLPLYHTASRELGYASGLTWVTQVMVGLSDAEVCAICTRCVTAALSTPMTGTPHPPGIRICEEVRDFIAELHARGFTCAIVSASCRWPVQAVAPLLGIPSEHVLAIDMIVDERGLLTSEIIPPVTYRQGKLDAIIKRFERPPQVVFGDAITDFEMLERATHIGVLIDRGNADILEAIAPHAHILAQPRDDLHFGP